MCETEQLNIQTGILKNPLEKAMFSSTVEVIVARKRWATLSNV